MRLSIVTRTFLATAALASIISGCSSGGSGGAIPLSGFASEFAKAFCHRVYSCCDAIERGMESVWGPTESDCRVNLTDEFSQGIAEAQFDIDAGLVIFHPDSARRCVNDITSLSCADWGVEFDLDLIPSCRLMIEGTLALGAACTSSDHCVSRLCSPDTAGTGMVCVASPGLDDLQPIGSACDQDADCLTRYCPLPVGTEPRTCRPPGVCDGS
jgi:hypothetical protein